MAAAAHHEKLLQLQALNEFLAKITALDTVDKRFDKYKEVFYKLHAQQRLAQINWSTPACKQGDLGELVQKIANLTIGNPAHVHMSTGRPISYGQRAFFNAFSVFMEKDLREVAVNRSCRRNCPAISKWYNTQLISHIDTYLSSLDTFMRLQEQADAAHTAQGEDAEYEEKCTRKEITNLEHNMTNEFLQVILYLFAVPQEVPLRVRTHKFKPDELTPPLEPSPVHMDVTWMNEDCKWYQQNARFMEFLADCAVIALMRSCYEFSPSFIEICQSYKNILPDYEKTDAFEEHVRPQEVIDDDSLSQITNSVRSDAHARRPHTAPSADTRRALLELQAMYNNM